MNSWASRRPPGKAQRRRNTLGPDAGAGEQGVDDSAGVTDDGASVVKDPALVLTRTGPVRGTITDGQRAFLGIPYAEPPTGTRRWTAPQPAPPWTRPRSATAYGPACVQDTTPTRVAFWNRLSPPASAVDEDCLTLNVWTPNPAPSAPAPVMVWIHGGAFRTGSGSLAAYEGHQLAKAGMVVVTLNYRLGPLGFFAHPALGAGNYGLLDQQAALRWVRDNIAAFGGDPERVTLFGESAGAASVCFHLVAPESRRLFQRAIMQSGTCLEMATSRADAEKRAQELAGRAGCGAVSDPVACLRARPASAILAAEAAKGLEILAAGGSGPYVDGVLLPDTPEALLTAGRASGVPVLLGANRDEGTIFVGLADWLNLTAAQYWLIVSVAFGANAAGVLARYPAAAYDTPAAAMADLIGDASFVCTMRRTARTLSANRWAVYLYAFTRVPSFLDEPFYGAFHAAEIPFVFGTGDRLGGFTAAERSLSAAVMGYWTRFAASGTPELTEAVSWPRHDAASDRHLVLDLSITAASGLKSARCDYFDSILP